MKSGFSSGYSGEGPRGLSTALQLLSRHGAEINEYLVGQEIIERIDSSCLLAEDIQDIDKLQRIRPHKWYDYIFEHNSRTTHDDSKLKYVFPITVPYALLDIRLIDLALRINEDPDGSITSGYRRLEDIVRGRSGLAAESGSRLFSKAFQGENSVLHWNDIDGGEQHGKATLFTGVFNAYRNRRAHREIRSRPDEILREFLLINELFVLEEQAVAR